MGFTFIKHTCYACGLKEVLTAVTDTDNCCGHGPESTSHHHSTDELVFSCDCCTHEAERLLTGDIVRSEVQTEIIPYFAVATVVNVIPENIISKFISSAPETSFPALDDLPTLHCQILS